MVSAQKEIPKRSDFMVNDFASMLSRDEVVRLGKKLADFSKSTGTQIVVVTEESLEGEDSFEYAYRLADNWKMDRR